MSRALVTYGRRVAMNFLSKKSLRAAIAPATQFAHATAARAAMAASMALAATAAFSMVAAAAISSNAPPASGASPTVSSESGAVETGSGAAATALDAEGQLRDPLLQGRYERITHDLRCLVCQNESVADSNAPLAEDLRRQVREMLVAGKGDEAVFDFMTARYGDFVRYNPPLEAKTLLIWGAPFIMLLIGVAVIIRVVRQRSHMPLDDEIAADPMGEEPVTSASGAPEPGSAVAGPGAAPGPRAPSAPGAVGR